MAANLGDDYIRVLLESLYGRNMAIEMVHATQ